MQWLNRSGCIVQPTYTYIHTFILSDIHTTRLAAINLDLKPRSSAFAYIHAYAYIHSQPRFCLIAEATPGRFSEFGRAMPKIFPCCFSGRGLFQKIKRKALSYLVSSSRTRNRSSNKVRLNPISSSLKLIKNECDELFETHLNNASPNAEFTVFLGQMFPCYLKLYQSNGSLLLIVYILIPCDGKISDIIEGMHTHSNTRLHVVKNFVSYGTDTV